ncbi:MAG: glycogen debranching enzyme family protein, partial [Anaerolineae bacterium]|nr:glycogen debranching enzyme family protein [Anaerolineae bacterium]
MLDYGREICSDALATRREWLVTNGIGGFASGTLAGVNTRRYHGLLIAALDPPLGRTLLVSGLRDQVDYDGAIYPLAAQAMRPGAPAAPGGVDSLLRFHLDDTTPVWMYAFEDALLEKRVWMQTAANTTYVRYQLLAGSLPAALQIDVQVNWRDMHGNTRAEQVAYTQAVTAHGLKIGREGEVASLYILSRVGEIAPGARRAEVVFLAAEHERGLNPLDHVSTGASLRHTLTAGETLTLTLTTEADAALDGDAAFAEQHQREDSLVLRSPLKHAPDWISHLVLAADQFIVRRAVEGNADGRSVIAGYHWFGDWGRD